MKVTYSFQGSAPKPFSPNGEMETFSFEYITDAFVTAGSSLGSARDFAQVRNISQVIFTPVSEGDWLQVSDAEGSLIQFTFPNGAFMAPGVYTAKTSASTIEGTLTVTAACTYAFATSGAPPFSASFQYQVANLLVFPPSVTASPGTAGFSCSGCDSVHLDRVAVPPGRPGMPIINNDVITIQFSSLDSARPGPSQTYYFQFGAFSKTGTYQTVGQGGGDGTLNVT